MSGNQALAAKVLRELARLGVREFAIAAGARNAPLIAPLPACRGITIRHFFDERSAAFFALGRAMVERTPVAVVTTSGTAVAELLPAVMEAHYQGVPLVLVTADRPRRFRGSGAPQSVEQPGIFGCYAEPTLDLDAGGISSPWPQFPPGRPLHVNVCFEEPPGCDADGIDFSAVEPSGLRPVLNDSRDALAILESWLGEKEPLLVLAGGLNPSCIGSVTRFLRTLNAPVVAEATANLHAAAGLQDLLLPAGESTLRQMETKRVVRIGAVPSWRWWRELEDRPEVAVLNISEPRLPGLARTENVVTCGWELLEFQRDHCLGGRPDWEPPPDQPRLARLLDSHPRSEPAWIRHISRRVPAGSTVFLGNSLPVREWNLAAASAEPGTSFFANRGANGIDGIVSTYLGVSASARESWLVIGDLSALCDLNAAWILQQLPAGNRRIVVINNGGGRIFSRVESLRALTEPVRQVIENRHALGFEAWAGMWGMGYLRCTAPGTFDQLPDGASVIEILPDESETEAFWSLWSAQSAASAK